jgi:hypothetical protein
MKCVSIDWYQETSNCMFNGFVSAARGLKKRLIGMVSKMVKYPGKPGFLDIIQMITQYYGSMLNLMVGCLLRSKKNDVVWKPNFLENSSANFVARSGVRIFRRQGKRRGLGFSTHSLSLSLSLSCKYCFAKRSLPLWYYDQVQEHSSILIAFYLFTCWQMYTSTVVNCM